MHVKIDRQIFAKLRIILYKECNKRDVGLPVTIVDEKSLLMVDNND